MSDEPATVADLDIDEIVYVASHSHSPVTVHTKDDCGRLERAKGTPTESKAKYQYQDRNVCKECAGTVESTEGSDWNSLTTQLREADPEEVSADG